MELPVKINACLILAAGYGTRMGVIGQEVPKALWPLFDKEILYLQLCLVKKQGIRNVFINSHHQTGLVEKYIDSIRQEFKSLDIKLLHEEVLLDSGGAIHNCLPYVKDDYLLVINADVFYLPTKKYLEELKSSDAQVILMAIDVEKQAKYNRLVVADDRQLLKIVPPSTSAPTITFSGVSLVNCQKIEQHKGVSKFFDTVANFKNSKVQVQYYADYEYLDFGTKDDYIRLVESLVLTDQFPNFKEMLKVFGCFTDQSNKNIYLTRDTFWNYGIKGQQFYCGSLELKDVCKDSEIVLNNMRDRI